MTYSNGASPPNWDWRTTTTLQMCAVGAGLAGCWHLAAASTAAEIEVGDLGASFDAAAFQPATYAVFTIFLVVFVAGIAGLAMLWGRWRGRRRGRPGMADRHEVRKQLGERRARASAEQTRPGLSERDRKRADLSEIGLEVGIDQASRQKIVLSFEDHLAVQAITGAGKSAYVMVPASLSAPGALIVTSNEVSILDVIAVTRERLGRLWVFDPLGRSHWPTPMVWDPVAGCEDGEVALARGIAFAAGLAADDKASTNTGFFQKNAMMALSRMLHAAALGGRQMTDVVQWAKNLESDAKIPAQIIRSSDHPDAETGWASTLEGVASGADETVASSRQTLAQAVEPLDLRKVMRWVTPAPDVEQFDPKAFVTSTDTLVLLSDDSSSTNVGPLCTMLFQEVIDAIKSIVPLLPVGKLDPPMRIAGDEIANIAPIPKLPEVCSEVRKLGVQCALAFQSELQAKMRWGEIRGQILLEQMAAELVLPGLKSTASLNRFSHLAGKVDVEQHTWSYSEGGVSRGGSSSDREREVLRAAGIRKLEDDTALLLWRNAPPAIVEMTPWFKSANAKQLIADAKATSARRRAHAAATGVLPAVEEKAPS